MAEIDFILEAFLVEGIEGLEQATDDVMSLEKEADQEVMNRVFRALHSIKGNASMLGMIGMAEFVHILEDTCSTIRSGEQQMDRRVADGLLKSFDFLNEIFAAIRETGEDATDYSRGELLLAMLRDEAAGPAVSATAPEAKPEPEDEPEPAVETLKHQPLKPRAEREENLKGLVVDDDFAARNSLRAYISRFMPCYVASDGREAIEAVRESFAGDDQAPFDLIIMDIMMPEVDGLEAVKTIRAIELDNGAVSFESEAVILMASAVDDDKTMLKAVYECGANAYFVKPLDFAALRRQLVRHMLIAPEAGK